MSKFKKIFNDLRNSIIDGNFKVGDKLPTGDELCAQYSVSRITVVRAMNDLELMGFVKKTPGKGTYVLDRTRSSKSPVFHLLSSGLSDLFYRQMIISFTKKLRASSALGAVMAVGYELDYLKEALDYVLRSGTNGLVVMHSGSPDSLDEFSRIVERVKDVPVLIAQRKLEGFKGTQVIVDEIKGGYLAAKHLISIGYDKLVYMGLDTHFFSGSQRFQGFLQACDENEVPERNRIIFDKSDLYSISDIKCELEALSGPFGVVVPSESQAFLAYELLVNLGLRIPEDAALVAIYGSNHSTSAAVPFTTVDWPGEKMGTTLAEKLLRLHTAPKSVTSKESVITLDPHLVVRVSCGSNKNYSRHALLKNDF